MNLKLKLKKLNLKLKKIKILILTNFNKTLLTVLELCFNTALAIEEVIVESVPLAITSNIP